MLRNEEENPQSVYSIQFTLVLRWKAIFSSNYLLYFLSWALWIAINAVLSSGFQVESIIMTIISAPVLYNWWVMISNGWSFSPTHFPLVSTYLWELGCLGGLWLIYRKEQTSTDVKLPIYIFLFFLSTLLILIFGKEIINFYSLFLMILELNSYFYPTIFDLSDFHGPFPLQILSWSFFWIIKIPQIDTGSW